MFKQYLILLCFVFSGICNSQNIYTYAGTGIASSSGDGSSALSASVYAPTSVYIDPAGNLFITTCDNRVRVVNAAGIINTTVCCSGGDGNPATSAGLYLPYGITFDPLGNMYIADCSNNKIRKINTSGIISTTVGIGGPCSFLADGGPATSASLCSPSDVSFDAFGNMYIADHTNNRIRKVNTSGIINTIAGTSTVGYAGDGGPATAARLDHPSGVKVDATGNIYIVDELNHRIRKVDPSGIITTIAGTGVAGHTGDGAAATVAQMNRPQDIALDGAGNIFIAELNCIRKINNLGIISTVAGTGVAGYSGDGGPAFLAQLDGALGLCLDALGNIYVADLNNNRVRIICKSSCITGINEIVFFSGLEIYPNPASDKLFLENIHNQEIKKYLLHDITGKEIPLIRNNNEFDVSNLREGLYFLQLQTKEGILIKKIVIQR